MKYIYLLIPCILSLVVPFYNRLEPDLLGFPFFYWYLMLLIPLSSLFVYLAYRSEKR